MLPMYVWLAGLQIEILTDNFVCEYLNCLRNAIKLMKQNYVSGNIWRIIAVIADIYERRNKGMRSGLYGL